MNTVFLQKAYNWAILSVIRIAIISILFALLLTFISLEYSPFILGFVAAALLFLLGILAHRIRHSAAALDYPGIDRFFQRVPCYLSIQDKHMRIIRTNQLFRRDFGDKIGELCHKAYKGSDIICENCPVVKTFEDGQTHTTEETVITKDGEQAQMIVYTTPIYNEDKEIAGVMEMSTNITEIKKLQERIDASRREYMDLFERVPCYLSVQDRDFRILRVNKLFRQQFGNSTGKYCYEVYQGRNSICPDCHVAETLKDGKIHSKEKTVIKYDGTEARLIVYSSPIYDEQGNITSVMEMSTDITEVKKLQQELTLMGSTIAVMAHRIKNILMGLEGGIFVLNTGMEEGDEATIKQGWGMVQRNVGKVSKIVKDLLYCSREREMNFQIIDPIDIVRNVFELFKEKANQEGIGLFLEIREPLPKAVFDPDALHSMLTNLVTNALDACLNDSTEGKEHHEISLRCYSESGSQIIFEVEDNGSGIPGAVGEHIFEDFFSTKGREGTGLGLLVAQKVVKEHGGTITFRSDEGLGTTFRASFPLKKSL